MAARDVAGFVRDDAFNLVGIVGGRNESGVDAHIESAGEGVGRRVADNKDVDDYEFGPTPDFINFTKRTT